MTLKDQWKTIKDNWLIVLVLAVLVVLLFGGNLFGAAGSAKSYASEGLMVESAMAPSAYRGVSYDSGDFTPEAEERQIIKTSNLAAEVKRGTFSSAEAKLKAIATSSDSYILNENVRKQGTDRRSYMVGSYQLKVEVQKYDSVIAQLREIGEVQSFSENAQDVTGRYTDLQDELDAEKARLARYKSMYNEATDIEDKINLNDRIFDQERRVKYLEEAIENIDKKVEYSTVYVTITEKRSDYADVIFVKFSELIRDIVGSFNSLLHLIFLVIPYAIAALIIWVVYRFVKKRK